MYMQSNEILTKEVYSSKNKPNNIQIPTHENII